MYSLLDVKVKIRKVGKIETAPPDSDHIFLLDANHLYLKTADGYYLVVSNV